MQKTICQSSLRIQEPLAAQYIIKNVKLKLKYRKTVIILL